MKYCYDLMEVAEIKDEAQKIGEYLDIGYYLQNGKPLAAIIV